MLVLIFIFVPFFFRFFRLRQELLAFTNGNRKNLETLPAVGRNELLARDATSLHTRRFRLLTSAATATGAPKNPV
jgi:hypothetical protein